MARGFDSKSVEDQIASKEPAMSDRQKAPATPEAAVRQTRRESLQLARTRAFQDLQLTCNTGHRAMLEKTIEHLDAELDRS